MPIPSQLPPRLSDLHGTARLEALYARAARERQRFEEERGRVTPAGLLARLFGQR